MEKTGFAIRHEFSAVMGREPWYVVPVYRPDGNPSKSATVVNRAGEHVAHFEQIEDAERAVEAVNGRT